MACGRYSTISKSWSASALKMGDFGDLAGRECSWTIKPPVQRDAQGNHNG